ncbi:hypothetical protein [Elioraea rosea]|uniref:hypothetical protein n=1 Tax=Elioraea rosea TaxID=2492390 RepID=UPI001183F2D5|nr:hypothetical protein [Elioraea rosea]
MIAIGEIRTWLGILGNAVRARVPADLVAADAEPDDARLDGYLVRAAALSAAGYWVRGFTLPGTEQGYRIMGAEGAAALTNEVRALRDAAAALPLPGLAAALDLALSLALLGSMVAALIWISGRRPVPWRVVAATTLAVYLVMAVWGLASAWFGLKLGGFAFSEASLRDPSAREFAVRGVTAALGLASVVMPPIALGRAARVVAPGLRLPFLSGLLAWACFIALAFATVLSGLEGALIRLLSAPG